MGKLRVTQQLAPKQIRLRLHLRRDKTDTSVKVPLAPQVAWGAAPEGDPLRPPCAGVISIRDNARDFICNPLNFRHLTRTLLHTLQRVFLGDFTL